MGYLTTFTIYNDGAENINPSKTNNLENIKQLASAVYHASLNVSSEEGDAYSVANHSNFLKAQKPRHADDPAVYVHLGNTVTEMNAHNESTIKLFRRNPEFAKQLMTTLENQVKDLKNLMKEFEAEKKV